MQVNLLIHAPNIHTGGGRVLLQMLIDVARHTGNIRFIVDRRLRLPEDADASLFIRRVSPSLTSRLLVEFALPSIAMNYERVLCFGNLPPIRRLPVPTSVFIQNRYLVESIKTTGFAKNARLRILGERNWLRTRLRNADDIIVQTDTMKRLVQCNLQKEARTLPFWRESLQGSSNPAIFRKSVDGFRFVYPASGEPHKNHLILLAAWKCLSAESLTPTLVLTLDPDRDAQLLALTAHESEKFGIKVENQHCQSDSDIRLLMKSADAIVFPSHVESFGIPLLEACGLGIPIIASENDVVRDILDPVQGFDPTSPISIARAVTRFLGVPTARTEILNPADFLKQVCS